MQSAIAILFPGVDIPEIEKASASHDVSILLKEHYNPNKNYKALTKPPKRYAATVGNVHLLFIFSDGTSLMVNNTDDLKKVQRQIDRMSHYIVA